MAGKVISMAPAVPAVRLLTHETYKLQLMRPEEGDWDTTTVITEAVKAELHEVLEWTRKWNRRGAPIRRKARMQAESIAQWIGTCQKA